MIAKRVPPTVPDPDLTRVIRDIYEVLNEIIDAVGKYDTSPPKHEERNIGNVSVIKMDDNTYRVSVKSAEGWVVSTGGHTVPTVSVAYSQAELNTILANIYVVLNGIFEFQERI